MDAARRTLVSATLGTMAVLVAFTAPLATLNETASGLGADAAGRTWILSSMAIGLGAFLLTAGRLADDYGRRRAFVAGSVALAAGSSVAAAAPDVGVFMLARIVTGVGGAAVIAAGLGMIAVAFPDLQERARATGWWGASVGAGIAVGPLLSTWLGRWHSWRDVYVVLAVAAVLVAASATGCRESRATHRARLDLPGVVLLAAGTGALLAGLTAGRQGWMRPAVITLLGVGVLLLASFVVVERRSAHPMIDLGLFRRPSFAAVTTAAFAIGGGIIALLSFISGFTGRALDMAPTTTAWLMLAWSGPSVLTAIAARRLPNRWTGRARMATTLGVIAVGQLMLWGIDSTSGAGRFLPGLLLAGVATGVLNAALGRESVASVPEGQSALGSGANNTARYLGSALGVTVVSVVATPSGAPTTAALLAGWNHAVIVTAVVSLLGALIVLLVGERPAIASRHEVPSAQDDGTLENAGTSRGEPRRATATPPPGVVR